MFPMPNWQDANADFLHHSRSLLQAYPAPPGTEGKMANGVPWSYGVGGYQPPSKIGYNLNDGIVVACDWIGFLCLFAASMMLMYKLFAFKGPDGDQDFFIGYREEKCLSIFVNLIAALTYWGRIAAHFNGDVGLALNVNFYKYFDYIFTCPILTLDLLWTLNLPYKFTYAAFVLLIMVNGVFCNSFEPPARYLWFVSGCFLFVFTWYNIIRLVYCRFQQFMNEDAKKVRAPLKLSLTLYFTIWCGYPALWILDEFGLIPGLAVHVLSMIMDVAAKSVYGFALLKFQLGVDKQDFNFSQIKSLRPPGSDYMPEQIRPSKQRSSRYGNNYDDDSSESGFRPTMRDRNDEPQFMMNSTNWDRNGGQKSDAEIEKTMSQIADLNKQLATLTGGQDR